MLSEIGNFASIVGLPLSFMALVIAIYHLIKLRGEARSAREASEETQALLRRDLTLTDLTKLRERLRQLIEANRRNDKVSTLSYSMEIQDLFVEVLRRHPNLQEQNNSRIRTAISVLTEFQAEAETLPAELNSDFISRFNRQLNQIQSNLLLDLESGLQ